MPVKSYKPTSPGRRGMSTVASDDITKTTPERRLTKGMKQKAGRNVSGKLTVRHRGGGHKRRYRTIDFKRDKIGIPGTVQAIEYESKSKCSDCPYRVQGWREAVYTCRSQDGRRRYRDVGTGCPYTAGQLPAAE